MIGMITIKAYHVQARVNYDGSVPCVEVGEGFDELIDIRLCLNADTPARAKAIAAAINGELDAQFEGTAPAMAKVKYDFDEMAVGKDRIAKIKTVLSGKEDSELLWHCFAWSCTPEGIEFWKKEASSGAPISDKARASLEAMVAQWDAEQATTS